MDTLELTQEVSQIETANGNEANQLSELAKQETYQIVFETSRDIDLTKAIKAVFKTAKKILNGGTWNVTGKQGGTVKTSKNPDEVKAALTEAKGKNKTAHPILSQVTNIKVESKANLDSFESEDEFEAEVEDVVQLSKYIVAFAGAAKVAQKLMSDGEDPMSIKEYTFGLNLSADTKIESETDVSLNIWRATLKQKLTMGYQKHMGLEINCTIVPAVSLNE